MSKEWVAVLNGYLAKQGLRLTRQRMTIAETFFATDGHPTIEDIHQQARKRNPRIGQATVYRTLKLLQDSGLASASRFGGEMTRFESTSDDTHHDHLICTRCGRIVEFFNPEIERLQEVVADDLGFTLTDHKQELYGIPGICVNAPECMYDESAHTHP